MQKLKPISFVFSLLSLLFWLPGCSSLLTSSSPDSMVVDVENAPTASMDEAAQLESEILYEYLTGELAYIDQDFDAAFEHFARASELSEAVVPPLHEKLAELSVRSGDLERALVESQKLLRDDPSSVEYRVLHASILESNARFDEAAQLYRQILDDQPERVDVAILLANVYIRQNKFAEGAAVLKQVEAADDADMLILFNLGRIAEMQKQKEEALSYYLRAFEAEPRSPLVVGDVLRLQLELEQYEQAEAFCRRVLDLQPDNAMTRKVLSHLLLGEKKIDEALQQFEALETMDETVGVETRLKIALIYMDKQNYREAIRQLLLILAEEPDNDEARFYLASIYAGGNRPVEALEELGKIDKGQAMYLKARTFSAFLLRQEGRIDEAAETILEAYEHSPDDLKIVFYASVILRDNDQLDEAEEILEDALEDNPAEEKLRYEYAVLLHEQGKVAKSLENMERLIQDDPAHGDALNFVAYTLAEEEKDLKRAEKYVRRALAGKPDDGYYLDTLGWVFFKQGKFAAAEEQLRQALSSVGTDAAILEHYADVLMKLERAEEALSFYKRAREAAEHSQDVEESVRERIEEKIQNLQDSLAALVPEQDSPGIQQAL